MHLDHLSFAATPEGLASTVAKLSEQLGEEFLDGGIHPRFGTRNSILPLKNQQYIEVVEVLDHPAADKAPFGQAVRERTQNGGGWLGWCINVDDIAPVEERIGRHSVPGNRRRPDGFNLEWRQIGVNGLRADPQLPFVICWEMDMAEHPSTMAPSDITLKSLEIAGSPERLANWLGETAVHVLDDIEVHWTAPHGLPGILTAVFDTPRGEVRL